MMEKCKKIESFYVCESKTSKPGTKFMEYFMKLKNLKEICITFGFPLSKLGVLLKNNRDLGVIKMNNLEFDNSILESYLFQQLNNVTLRDITFCKDIQPNTISNQLKHFSHCDYFAFWQTVNVKQSDIESWLIVYKTILSLSKCKCLNIVLWPTIFPSIKNHINNIYDIDTSIKRLKLTCSPITINYFNNIVSKFIDLNKSESYQFIEFHCIDLLIPKSNFIESTFNQMENIVFKLFTMTTNIFAFPVLNLNCFEITINKLKNIINKNYKKKEKLIFSIQQHIDAQTENELQNKFYIILKQVWLNKDI